MYLLQRIVENTNITQKSATVHIAQFIHPDLNRLIACAKQVVMPALNYAVHREIIIKVPNQQRFKGCVYMINSLDRYHDGGSCSHARRMRVAIYNIDKDYSPAIQCTAMSKCVMCGDPDRADFTFNSLM